MNKEEADVRPFDIFMAGNLALEYKSLFESLTQQSAQKLELTLAQLLQTEVTIDNKFEITQRKLNGNNCDSYYRSWIVINNHRDTFASVTVERALSTSILDILCGGTGKHTTTCTNNEGPGGGERRSLLMLIKTMFKQTEEVFAAITPIHMILTSKAQDAIAERLQVERTEFICSSTYDIKANEGGGMIRIDIPVSLIGKTNLGKYHMSSVDRLARLKSALEDVPLPITAIIGKQETSLRKVYTLSPGDIIPLDAMMDAELYVCEKLFHKGKVQVENGQLQLRIADFPEQEITKTDTTEDDSSEPSGASDTSRTSRRRSRSRQLEDEPASTPTQTRSERREARMGGRRKTRTQGDT